jgi:hypothetical protein
MDVFFVVLRCILRYNDFKHIEPASELMARHIAGDPGIGE